LRTPGGELITIDAPGAGSSVGTRFRTFLSSVNISARSININNRGTVTGNYVDSSNVSHGFLRGPGGEFTTFDAPGASSAEGAFDGTFPSAINDRGAVTGNYIDSKDLNHGFLRGPGGEFTTFDAPGSGSVAAAGFGTFPTSINDAGAIAGHYTDARNVIRGFVRSPSGKFATFEAPGASSVVGSGFGTFPESMNGAGAVTGHFADANGLYHGFLRGPGGEFAVFDAPGASSVAGSGNGTLPKSINDKGAITGHYADAQAVIHGFVRGADGKFTTFDAPGPAGGAGWGIFPESINDAGAVTGHYADASGLNHGFLRLP
ncbi:MAG TPA: hypothetical protein VLV29_08480, partial [Steroidobacteraceae bacterium]|nr:hypothetical protein [Steroidobacteraceae bacterium]